MTNNEPFKNRPFENVPLLDPLGDLLDTSGDRTPALLASAEALLIRPDFAPRARVTERTCLILRPQIKAALDAYAPAYAFIGTPTHEIVRMECREQAASKLNTALEREVVISIREALALAGQTDHARINDICRVVIAGK